MIRFTVLFLAVSLASGFHFGRNPTPPKWAPSYKVEAEIQYTLVDVKEPLKLWVDGRMTRFDYNGGTNRFYDIPSVLSPDVNALFKVFPTTTENELNEPVCLYYSSNSMADFDRTGELPDMTNYTFVGKERLLGKNTFKWQYVSNMGAQSTIETMWVTDEMGTAGHEQVKNPVPLRYEYKWIVNVQQSKVSRDYIVNYYNYEITKVNPEIFMLSTVRCGLGQAETTTEDHFNNFKIKHGKKYSSEEEHGQRLHIFKHNLRNIEAHNRAGRGYKLAVNHLADRTPEELTFSTGLLATRSVGGLPFPYEPVDVQRLSAGIPQEWDWRIHGAVTPIKDQLKCGSCWAFSAVGAVEGALKIHSGRPVERLSEQALIDCSWGEHNNGCEGGSQNAAFDWIKKHGLPRYLDYGGYLQREGLCHRNNVSHVVNISDYVRVTSNSDALRLAIFRHGPVAVSINTSPTTFMFYSEGVYDDKLCKTDLQDLNHAVLVVGYGVLDGQKYWLVKNSWGSSWGNGGYILMSAEGNTCGILDVLLYVTVE